MKWWRRRGQGQAPKVERPPRPTTATATPPLPGGQWRNRHNGSRGPEVVRWVRVEGEVVTIFVLHGPDADGRWYPFQWTETLPDL